MTGAGIIAFISMLTFLLLLYVTRVGFYNYNNFSLKQENIDKQHFQVSSCSHHVATKVIMETYTNY